MKNTDKQLNELSRDIMAFMFGVKPKRKIKRPVVKQLTYKGVTKKWYEDGNGKILNFIGKPNIDYDFAKKENENSKQFVMRLIDEGTFK